MPTLGASRSSPAAVNVDALVNTSASRGEAISIMDCGLFCVSFLRE